MAVDYSGTPDTAGTFPIQCVDNDGNEFTLNVQVAGNSIRYTGRPNVEGTFPIQCVDDNGDNFTLYVRVIPSGSTGSGPECWLEYYGDDSGSPTHILHLPFVQSIEEVDSAQITEISTIVYGYDNNFVMDTGTVQKYTITFMRVQPAVVRDTDDFNDQSKWSNGHWFKMFKRFTEKWQNLNYGMNSQRQGGFTLHFSPGSETYRSNVSYADLFPNIDCNAFILGAVTMQMTGNNLQYMKISLPLTVGSMVRVPQQRGGHNVTVLPNIPGYSGYTVTYPVGWDFPAPHPRLEWFDAEWLNYFTYWNSGIYPGQIVTSSVNYLTANWKAPYWVGLFTADAEINFHKININSGGSVPSWSYEDDFTIPALADASMIRVWVVGGGGGGGFGEYQYGNTAFQYGGGGGSSGGFATTQAAFDPNDDSLHSIRITVGSGGYGQNRLNLNGKADDGGGSSVVLRYQAVESDGNNTPTVSYVDASLAAASGGKGGYREVASGGSVKNGAVGGTGLRASDDGGPRGGNGGAVPFFSSGEAKSFPVTYPTQSNVVVSSTGGEGAQSPGSGTNGDGYGSGGGGGLGGNAFDKGGDGAPGIVMIAFYR